MGEIKLVRFKKPKASLKSTKKSVIDKFNDAIQRQISICKGEVVRRGKGIAKSWLQDGTNYGCEKVLIPMIGTVRVWPTSAISVDTSRQQAGVAELQNLAVEVQAGNLSNRIYTSLRNAKKGAKPKTS